MNFIPEKIPKTSSIVYFFSHLNKKNFVKKSLCDLQKLRKYQHRKNKRIN